MFHLDRHNAAFAAAIVNEPGPEKLGYEKARESLEMLQKTDPAPDTITETIEVNGKCGSTSVTVVRSKALASKKLPMIYYAHGGGWILGSPTVYASFLSDFARRTGAAIVFPYYTPAPEKQFPFQFEQTYEVLDYLVRNGDKHNLETAKIALAGDSVGGHMSIAWMQLSLERKLPAEIAHVLLFNPVTDTHKKMPSYETFKDGPFLTADSMDWMIDAFLPDKKDRQTALASPLTFLPDEVLAKFPPTTIIVASVDPLLDEALAFGARLQNAGIETSIIRAEGQVHAFVVLNPLRDSPTAKSIMELVSLKLRTALSPAA